jgi:hypothetical protein
MLIRNPFYNSLIKEFQLSQTILFKYILMMSLNVVHDINLLQNQQREKVCYSG